MTFDFCKLLIEKKMCNQNDMLEKLDIFLLRSRISREQYDELIELMG